MPNSFASFTSLPKIGINPNSTYRTPIGIYAYNTAYVLKLMGSENSAESLPFAGHQEYVHLFQATGKIIILNRIKNIDKIYKKLKKVYVQRTNNTDFSKIIKYSENSARNRSEGGRLWYVTMIMSDILSGLDIDQARDKRKQHDMNIIEPNEIKPESRTWNGIFRAIGVNGVIDTGAGIIHPSEESQAVFFSRDSISNIQMHRNRYSPETTRIEDHERSHNVTIKRFTRMKNDHQRVELLYNIYNGDIENIYSLMDYAIKAGFFNRDILRILRGGDNQFHKQFIQMAAQDSRYLKFFDDFVFKFELGYANDSLPGKEALVPFIITRYNNFPTEVKALVRTMLMIIAQDFMSINEYVSTLSLAVKYLDSEMIEELLDEIDMSDSEMQLVKARVPGLDIE